MLKTLLLGRRVAQPFVGRPWGLALLLALLLGPLGTWAQVTGTKTVGATGADYPTLSAAMTAVNGGISGSVVLELQSNYVSTGETFPISYTLVPTGGATVTIRPAAAGLSVVGLAASTSVFTINGGKGLVIDGRVGGAGTTPDLTITGVNTGGNTIQFTNNATSNTVQYCQVKGVNTASANGVIAFTATATAAGGGNSNNTIANNKISDNAGTLPTNLIYSIGSATAGAANAANTVSNNELFNYYNASTNSAAVLLSGSNAGGNTAWTISGNSIYQTATRTATSGSTHYGVLVSTGVGYTISNNFIGGNAASAASGTMTYAGGVANRFVAIQGTFTSGAASGIQGNTIRRLSVSSTSGTTTAPGIFAGIYVATGDANIGTTTGNVVGDASAAGSIVVSGTTAGAVIYGINTAAAGAINISNNTVGNMTFTISNGLFYCIQGGTGTATVAGNTITGNAITTSGTGSSTLNGYYNFASPTTENIANNTITGLTIGGTSTATGQSLRGVNLNTITGDAQVLTGNTISGLAISPTGGSGTVTGIYFTTGGNTGSNIARNKLYDLSAGGAAGVAHGINIAGGGTYPVNNNLIGDLRTPAATSTLAISGIIVGGATAVNLYYNTVYLNASSTGATFGTSGIYLSSTTPTVTLLNNIVDNKSTPGSTSGLTVALRRTSTAVTGYASASNNNLYYAGVPAANRLLYYDGSNPYQTLATFRAGPNIAPRESASKTEDVPFASTTGSASAFLHIAPTTPTQVESGGVAITGLTDDYDATGVRTGYPLAGQANGGGTAPDIGADEGDFSPLPTVDVGITALTAPASGQTCYSATETVTATLKNFSSTALDFSVNNVTVSGSVSGPGGPTTFTNVVLSSGTLAGGATQAVTFSPTVDLSAPGTYTFTIAAAVANDFDATNNGLPTTPAGTNTRTVAAPTPGTASVTPATSCGPTTATLTATGAAGGTVTWYSSADGYTTAIGTGSPLTTASLTATTSFKEQVVCGANVSAFSNTVTVTVSNPNITGTNTGVTRCSSGNVTLTATSSPGSTPRYYTAATGGTAFASGASASVNVTGNTTYYVGAQENGSTSVAGLASNVSNGTSAGTTTADYALGFNVTAAGTLVSVDVYPTVAGTSSIQLYTVAGGNPGAGTIVSGAVVSRAFTAAEVGTKVTVPLGFALTAGGYKLSNPVNGAGFVRYATGSYTGSYPLTSGPISVTHSYGSAATGTTSNTSYNNFFNLTYFVGCEPTARTPIQVNVTPAPAITPATTASTVCANSTTTIAFSGYTSYSVTPAASAAVNGSNIAFTPAATTTYTVTGTDGTCSNTATVTLTVTPVVAGTASSNPGSFCGATSGAPVLSLSGTSGQTSFVWQQSSTGLAGSFTDIPGSTGITPFTAPTITATTYYQAVATCGSNNAFSNVVPVLVGNPTIATTNSPVTRCGAGTVTLTATSSAGATTYYYATATSITPLGSGAAQVVTVAATPATQTFYVAARNSTTPFVAGLSSNSAANGTYAPTPAASDYPLGFAVTTAGTLQSVDIYPGASTSSVTIRLIRLSGAAPAAGTVVSGSDIVVPISAAQRGTLVTVPVNYYLTPGNYKITNATGVIGRYTAYTGTYPLTNGPISVTGSYSSTTNSAYSNTNYHGFFNLSFAPSCESARTPIDVNVTVPPALAYTGTPSVCTGSSTVLTFSPASYTALTVTPTATAVVSGNTITFSPTTATTYTITGNDGTGAAGCTATTTVAITLSPTPNAPTLAPTAATICAGSSTVVAASSSTLTLTNQTILSVADFEAGANGFTASPAVTNPINGFTRQTGTYSLGSGPTSYSGPNAAGAYYVADSDKSNTAFISTLTSPAFSTMNYTAATISVQQYYKHSAQDYAGIDYSTDNGATWVDLTFYLANIGNSTGVQAYSTYALPADALGKAQVKFRFYYEANDDWYWAIDNVSVTGTKTESATFAVIPATGASVSGANITFNPTTTTTYSVTGTFPSSPGCPSPATPITITVNPQPTATATNNGPVCAGSPATVSVALTGTGPWNLTYSDGTTSTPVTGITASPYTFATGALSATTTYTLTALSDANCTATAPVASTIVTVNPLPSFTTTPTNVSCFGSSTGSITVTVAGGTAPYSYSIDNGGTYTASTTNPYTFTGLPAGTYQVLVKGQFCTASAAQPVTITQPASALSVTPSKTDETAAGANDGTVTATATGGTSPYQYSLNNGAPQPSNTFAGLAPGNYAVTVSDAGGCSTTSTTVTVGTAAPGVCTLDTWNGSVSTDWFTPANWSCGQVPTATTDALIPTGVPNYPNLNTTATAAVRSLTLSNGASLAQTAGALDVYGDLTNNTPAANVALTGGAVRFVSTTAQTLNGAEPLRFFDLTVNKGSDTLHLTTNQTVAGTLALTSGILKTYVLGNRHSIMLPGTITETAASFVLGDVEVPAANLNTDGASSSFGGLGLTLTVHGTRPNGRVANLPGLTTVVRSTGTPVYGATPTTGPNAGMVSRSIRRQYAITPAPGKDTNLSVDMVFGYNDSPFELNSIAEGSLRLFSAPAISGPYRPNGGLPNTAANTVSCDTLDHLSVWTLGNLAAPLPVELTAFTAERQGLNAHLAWSTASEKSNAGFEVQVSTNGREFRKLGFVASATPGSSTTRQYAFLDAEKGKAGLRYYRLRQLDLSGAAEFSPVRTVRFEAEGFAGLALVAAPNPFQGELKLVVTLPTGTAAAPAQLRLTDAAGRLVLTLRTPALAAGQSPLAPLDLHELASGVYFVQLAFPGQPAQYLKVVKE